MSMTPEPLQPPKARAGTISDGLLMVPPKQPSSILLQQKHKRAGSTGTTGDESCTTDEDYDIDTTTSCCSYYVNDEEFGSYSDIATITDKLRPRQQMHRNSSDSSVYSDFEKCGDDMSHNGDKHNSDSSVDVVDFASAKETTSGVEQLKQQLAEAYRAIGVRDEELLRHTRIRKDVDAELEDLTASLFQEAHNMVREANEKQAAAEKALKESQMKVDVLTAEVSALKTLVLTSTPSHPNPHLHPQIYKDDGVFTKKHRRSPSHFNLKYGRENSPPESPVKQTDPYPHIGEIESKEGLEVDPVFHKEFLTWKQNPQLEKTDPFVKRLYAEDITVCLCFTNADLSQKVAAAIESESIHIEAVADKSKTMFPKKCALLEVPRLCFYRMSMGDSENCWYSISQICRNRIIAVCDFLNYLKYIQRGLVKSSVHDIYWEIVRLRKNIGLARLGLNLAT